MLWIWSTIWVNRDDPGRLVCSRHSLDNFDIAQVQGEVTRVTLDDVCSGRHESVIVPLESNSKNHSGQALITSKLATAFRSLPSYVSVSRTLDLMEDETCITFRLYVLHQVSTSLDASCFGVESGYQKLRS